MSVIYPRPMDSVLHNFIIENCGLESLQVGFDDVIKTLQRKEINPYVAGHIMGIDYAMNRMASKEEWPIKHPAQCQTVGDSDRNLYWIRDLHQKIMSPIAKYAEMLSEAQNPIKATDCGHYRLTKRIINMERAMPKPIPLKRLMHHWYSEIATFHLGIVDRLHNPGSISLAEWEEIDKKAYEFHLMLQCIHPFIDGTGRTARMVENALRLRWGLPWKTIKAEDRRRYVNDIRRYEDAPAWQAILIQHDAKIDYNPITHLNPNA